MLQEVEQLRGQNQKMQQKLRDIEEIILNLHGDLPRFCWMRKALLCRLMARASAYHQGTYSKNLQESGKNWSSGLGFTFSLVVTNIIAWQFRLCVMDVSIPTATELICYACIPDGGTSDFCGSTIRVAKRSPLALLRLDCNPRGSTRRMMQDRFVVCQAAKEAQQTASLKFIIWFNLFVSALPCSFSQ